MIKEYKYFILTVLIVLAATLRLIALDRFPNGFTGDEAQQGYSGYSILKTGKDEWGQTLPLNPRGFGDYKPPLYTYLTIPSEAIFGLNIFSVRLPAAIIGIIVVAVVYFLADELFGDEVIALWAALFMAISPWSIQISRTAFEGGIGILTFSLGLLFFLKSQKGQIIRNWVLSVIFFGLTFYTYHSWRVFTAMFIVGLVVLFRNKINFKKAILPIIVFIIFAFPMLFSLNTVLTRSSDVGIFSSQHMGGYLHDKIGSPLPSTLERILNNKIYFTGNEFISNYLSYFSPIFLFTGNRSDGTYLNFPYFPLLYPIELLFWLAAIYLLVKGQIKNRSVLILWFSLAIIPASLAVGAMNANRTPTLLPLTALISAIGANYLIGVIKRVRVIWGIAIGISIVMFLHFYFITLPNKPIENLRIGYKEAFQTATQLSGSYDKVIFSKAFTEPQIFVAFYSQMDPALFQKDSQDWLRYEKSDKLYVDQLESWNLENYYFQDLNWNAREGREPNALVVAKPGDFPDNINYLKEVKDPKGIVLYKLVITRQPKIQ